METAIATTTISKRGLLLHLVNVLWFYC